MINKRLQLLIADDEEAHIELIRRAFDDAGGKADIRAVGTQREYREHAVARPPDIALLDLNLPDGLAVEVLSHPPEDAPFPVLVMTAFGNEQTVVEVMKAGALDYIVKSPEAFSSMPHTVNRALREWALLQRHKQAEQQLAEEEASLCALTTAAKDAILMMNNSGDITFWNPAAERMLGWKAEEALGKNLHALIAPERFSQAHRKAFPAFQHTGEGAAVGKTLELEAKRKNGEEISIELSLSAVKIKGEWCAIGILRDISERKQGAAEKSKLEEQLRQSQKMECIGRLASGVAHDFNNILTAIKGYCALVTNTLGPEDPNRADMGEIMTAAERASALTRQLLAFSRKQIMVPKVVDLNKSLGDMQNMLRRIIGEDIKLSTEIFPAPCLAKVDPGLIEQVIMNLALNARDAVSKNGEITLGTEILTPAKEFSSAHPDLPPGRLVCVKVRDNGCGMSPEVMKYLFEPFYTTKEKCKGTGLGLSMVYGTVKQSEGEIEVESEPGHGSTFKLYFPFVEAGITESPSGKTEAVSPGGNETILLVEDEEQLRRLSERLLRAYGYTVISAIDGRAALEAIEQYGKPVDLLMTDLVMPGMSGRELALELARRKLARRTLYMSGYTDEAIVKHGVLEPGIAFIYKPFTVEGLTAKLREVLDGSSDQAKA